MVSNIDASVNRDEKYKITKFWKRNYKYGDWDAPKLDQGKVFALFQTLNPNAVVDFVGFNRRAGALGVKIKKKKNRKKYYYATPLTDVCNAHHFPQRRKEGGK